MSDDLNDHIKRDGANELHVSLVGQVSLSVIIVTTGFLWSKGSASTQELH